VYSFDWYSGFTGELPVWGETIAFKLPVILDFPAGILVGWLNVQLSIDGDIFKV